MQRKVGALERRAAELEAEIERLEEVKREVKAEIVRYEARLHRPRAGARAPPLTLPPGGGRIILAGEQDPHKG